ncbi:hypothetical protein EIP86_000692 [Pleurotus ostreatoroseus]|nr:hypothetical protein EIP86_000692 [Pleurotus ostreatoroseus]
MAPQPPPSGLFSNVLSYVSRELECFVATATGGDPPEHPKASTSRVKLDGARESEADKSVVRSGGGGNVKRRAEGESRAGDEPRAGPSRPSRTTVVAAAKMGTTDARPAQAAATRPTQVARRIADLNANASTSQTQMRQLTGRPVSVVKSRNKKPYTTMPGSLFPRSASLEPDPTPAFARVKGTRPQMRYAPNARSPLYQTIETIVEQGETSQRIDTVVANSPGSSANPFLVRDDAQDGPPTPKGIVSTSYAAARFLNERHPTPRSSPSPMAALTPEAPSVYEDVDEDVDEDEDDQQIRVSISKGKERAHDESYEFPHAETSQEIRIRGKEDELQQARDDQYRKEQELDPDTTLALEEHERDKERIKFLEAEVMRLRDELWHERSQGNISSSFIPPPPPPPPPPPVPPPKRTIIPPITVSSIRKKSNPYSKFTTEAFLQSARAALRKLDPPVEAPINSVTALPRASMRRKSIAQPTVNVPTEKMADFLEEVRSAKLKKVSSNMAPPLMRDQPQAESSQMGRSVSGAGKGRDILREMVRRKSLSHMDARAGDKRKRDAADNDEFAVPPLPVKRVAKQGSSASDTSTSSQASTVSNPFVDHHRPLSLADLNNRSWPSITTTDTDLTTPSLCSDNENDHASETGHDTLPPTPPRPHRSPEPTRPDEQDDPLPEIIEVIDVDSSPTGYDDIADTPIAGPSTVEDAFAHRPPRQPLPDHTPKKPRPPSRTRIPRPPLSQAQIQSQIQTPSHSSSQMPSERLDKSKTRGQGPAEVQRVPVIDLYAVRARTLAERHTNKRASDKTDNTHPATTGAKQPEPAMQASAEMSPHARRRRTLDEELRRAGDHLWSSDGPEEDELEHGTLVGVGVKKNHGGFLARGGGGGSPVFMGVGYVQGAEDHRH